MKFDGKSRPWDVGVEERGRELKERWRKEKEWRPGEVRLMAEGRMVGWDELAKLVDGTVVQVLASMRAEWERSPGKRRRRTLGNRMGREFHLGRKKFLGRMVARLKNSLMLSRKVN